MRTRFFEELQMLHIQLTKMGSMCEDAIELASQLLFEDNEHKFKEVKDLEEAIDRQERVIEDHCMRLILLEQPVAKDLKQVSAALKMISDMERIGDQALDIAGLPVFPNFSMETHLDDMTAMCSEMLRTTIRAFVGNDLKLAKEVVKMDDIVDDLFLKVKEEAAKLISQTPSVAADVLNLLMAAKYLERIGDHAVNISECVIHSLSEQHWGRLMIYLVEDDSSIQKLVIYTLQSQGYEAQGFTLPSDFYRALETKTPDLVILDIMLPEVDGITILQKLRSQQETAHLPIIMLTAKTSEYDTVLGLDSGADDYVSKPFRMMELLSRIKALLRRTQISKHSLQYRDLIVDEDAHIVKADGKNIILTRKEFDLLVMLLENQGRVLTRDQLLTQIWGYDFDGESRTVDVHVRTLRQKIEPCGNYIETIRGVGYKIGGQHS